MIFGIPTPLLYLIAVYVGGTLALFTAFYFYYNK